MRTPPNHTVKVLAIAWLMIAAVTASAQSIVIPPDYLFYSGDTLKDFNFKAYLDNPSVKSANHEELLWYLQQSEKKFVTRKYHLSADTIIPAIQNPGKGVGNTLGVGCNNADFEDGNYTGWTGSVGCNQNSNAALTITSAGINTLGVNSAETSCSWHTLVTTGTDPFGGFPMLDPGGGAYACRIGGQKANLSRGSGGCGTAAMDPGGAFGEVLQQTFTVTSTNSFFTFSYAVVLNDGGHPNGEEPYFSAQVFDASNNLITCLSFTQQCTAGVAPPGFLTSSSTGSGGSAVFYLPWTTTTFDLKPYIGTNITIVFTAAGCTLGGHFGYAYVDCSCSQVYPTVNMGCTSGTLTAPPGGTGYSWSGPGITSGSTSQTCNVDVSGTYSVTVTTAPGCTYEVDTTIVVPLPITITATPSPAICTSSNGSVTVSSVTGGTTPYTYLWSNGATTSSISNLPPGTYTLTVKDVNGCTQTISETVANTNTVLTPTITSTNVLCNGGATGSATITGVTGGGTAPYTYAWGSGQTTTSITGLTAGTYTVKVTDANGCTDTGSVTITQPNPIVLASTSSPTTCTGSTGTAGLTSVTGGTSPYSYAWNTGATTSSITNLAAGSYTVTVKDANGCTDPDVITVSTNGAIITPTMASTPALCNGGATGTASVTGVTGTGTSPYTYSWSSGQTTTNATALAAGTYTVTVKDANGCTGTGTVTVTQPTPVVVTATSTPATCTASTGTASVSSTTGGTGPYTYAWSTGSTSTSITNLAAATYTITATDANGCTGTGTVTVGTTTITLSPTLTSTPALCNGGSTGTTSVTGVTGGTSPYTYAWSGGQSTTVVNNLVAGTYTLAATDADGCTGTATVTVTQPTALTPSTANIAALCNGGNGSATASCTGGTAGYTYSWSDGKTGTSISDIAGTYTVTVTDANGCTATSTATITQPTALNITTSDVAAICGTNTGTASVATVTGGIAGYAYSWNTGASTSSINNVGAGTYTVTVTDANGCSVPSTVVVPNTGGPSDSIVSTTNILCYGGTNGAIDLGVAGGTTPYTFNWSNGANTQNLTGLSAGIYSVTVKDANGCLTTAIDTVKQPSQLRDSVITVTNPLCFGMNTGSITVGVTGGTPAYTYAWSDGTTNLNDVNIVAGSYSLTITDANGCTVTVDTTITQPTQLTLKVAGFPASCNGECNGQLVAIPNGGTTPYTYLWSNASTSPSQLNVCAGTYSITVTDANGCTVDSVGVIISQPTPITLVTSTTTSHCSQADGGACVTAGGGTPGYTYAWAAGATTSCLSNVVPGNYCVIVTDANKCADTICANVPNAPGDTANIIATTPVSCNGGSDGTATAQGTGGTSPYTYLWSNGQIGSNATGLPAGPYTVTVTDANGCSNTAVATITQPPLVVVTPPAPQTICINQSATLTVSAVGGNGGYNYTWTPGGLTGPTVTVTPTVTTTYTITTTDSKACPGNMVTVVVTVYPPLNITVSPDQSICPGGSATISANGSGGDGTYNYNWIPGGMTGATQTVSPGITTVYTVTLTDGCTTTPVTDTVKVTINPLPNVSFTADTLSGCEPLCVDFTDKSTISSGVINQWAWTFGDGDSSSLQDPRHCYDSAGVFTVSLKVTSNNGCSASYTAPNLITVFGKPVAKFISSPNPTPIVAPTVQFTDESTDAYGGISTWAWTFGDKTDSVSSKQNPIHTYGDTGTYCAQLIVTNIHGCMDTVTGCEVIEPYFTIFIPNAFSPNGDGLNDVFTAKGIFICTFEMYIFDRWGMQLYYTNDINMGWDGTVNGSGTVEQEDTYIYVINVTDCIEHKKHQYLGKVTLIK